MRRYKLCDTKYVMIKTAETEYDKIIRYVWSSDNKCFCVDSDEGIYIHENVYGEYYAYTYHPQYKECTGETPDDVVWELRKK